ncbi:UDP-2,3-diacylglucosamine diphosphatase [Guyparkeria hydrothermalis]|uniref:UDP-2,3-diacylglucosamine diphosphatase n=1 Tax=Guyparkeria TaxID=2035712 RepID=UPI0010AD49E5|nr:MULTISPECIES: UDP-2,3-diacylglucosamine diphosphatase [Guyparkeria]MCL7750833.1 UDP-2,3-diacylglucosamine diphosphatase [Guyparkeria hydrothermalis]TKA88580.1 UDP-2,3-diacylglucosamine diphosphatase [Guyparkeria sp. SB14A]
MQTRLPSCPPSRPTLHHYRTVIVSDVHLGTPDARPDRLLEFLGTVHCDTLILNGDLLDVWQMQRRRWQWSAEKSELFRRLQALVEAGTRVAYVPGNHDECFRAFVGQTFAGVSLHRELHLTLADGRRALVLHGDEFDDEIAPSSPARWLGDLGYGGLLRLDRLRRRLKQLLGRRPGHHLGRGDRHGSLVRAIKTRVPGARAHVARFEAAALAHARREGVDVIVCGHIHHPNLRQCDGVTYANSGDWVEGCSALVEHADGSLDVIEWDGLSAVSPSAPADRTPESEPEGPVAISGN